jgi:Asp-tRNA(Asn)/Glu-tRNA(Gln) amidotransferase A subunit family amidase
VGLQLVGAPLSEPRLLAAAALFEGAHPFANRVPLA